MSDTMDEKTLAISRRGVLASGLATLTAGAAGLLRRTPLLAATQRAASTGGIEFIADNPGDWALHCHKMHHTMNQMGHNLPVMTGVDQSGVTDKLEELVPGYMPMGSTGMGHMMDMGRPRNSLPMGGGEGPFGPIFMGGMFTVLKIREGLRSYDEDPGFYQQPEGTAVMPAEALRSAATAKPGGAAFEAVRR